MFDYFLKRLIGLIPTVLITGVLVFLFSHMISGNLDHLVKGKETNEVIVHLVGEGSDQSLLEEFIHFFLNILKGNFGISIISKRPVSEEISLRFFPTFLLTIASMIWSVALGLIIGVVSAVFRNRWPDRISMILAILGISFPSFVFGMLLIEVFSVKLGWLPAVGADSWKNYILPSITLGTTVAAIMVRFTRTSLLEVLQEDYIRTARAKGLPERWVVIKHGLRNAMNPLITMVGLQFGFLLGGSIVVEKLFKWPGLGMLLMDSVEMHDYPVIQAEVLLFSLEFILINFLVDMLYAVINPSVFIR